MSPSYDTFHLHRISALAAFDLALAAFEVGFDNISPGKVED